MERLESCLSKLCVCLLCTLQITLGTNGEIGQSSAQRNPYSSRSLVFHAAPLHAGHAVQRHSPHTSGVNAGAQEGLEAWRALVLHHEPTSLTRNAGMLQELLNFSFDKARSQQVVVQFDRDIDRYERTSGGNFPNKLRIGVALRMLPDGPLEQHLVLNSARFDHMGTAEGRNRQRRTRAGCCQLNTAAHRPISVWYPWTLQRMSQGDDIPKNAMSHLREDWPLEARLLAQRGESQAQGKGQGWQKDRALPAHSNNRQARARKV